MMNLPCCPTKAQTTMEETGEVVLQVGLALLFVLLAVVAWSLVVGRLSPWT
ncbi:MAG: hypothetical protein AVDCRST_MAG73-2714 [uncultured Thermomicrobiales bacterium]|uniref:Uncharacterized protein n=1 Tax=uncultured Thermomicrobiales bacterium TaxID=1645740 RepID=A0A6J4UHQ3_9BACT|nr:MAG: hypothetical protein AVDCRST_MAG73-2714 [uncultured Thermomicrobiales bacterium]